MNKYPAVKLIISFIVGIIFQYFFNLPSEILIFTLLIVFTLNTILLLIKKVIFIYYIRKASLLLLPFLVGALHLFFNGGGARYNLDSPKIRNARIVGQIDHIELKNEKRLIIELDVTSINELAQTKTNSTYLLSLWKDDSQKLDSLYQLLKVGNTIDFTGTVLRPKNQRNPGEFNYEEYLSKKGISGVINCYKLEDFQIKNVNINFFKNIVYESRKEINQILLKLYNSESASLLKGILLADRSDINYQVRTSFVNSGVIHVLAVSGLHVGFITAILFLLLGRFHLRTKHLISILGILCFLILTGAHASVFRASTMAIVYLISKLSGRSTNGFNSLCIAAFIILLLNPIDIFNPGFLLSFSAVLSILIIYPILSKRINDYNLRKPIKFVLLFIFVSLAAQLGTLPFTLIYFNKLSLISLIANLFVIPIIGFIVSIGILSIIASLISVWIASIVAAANIILIKILYYIIETASNFSFSHLPVFNFSIIDGILYYSFLTIMIFMLVRFKNKLIYFLCGILLVFSFDTYLSLDNTSILPESELSIVAIDVGQGDSFIIKYPNNKTALIDAGNRTEYFDNGSRIISPLLKRLEIDTLDYVFISHLDSDHYGGVISLIEEGIVKAVYKPYEYESIKDSIFGEYVKSNNLELVNYKDTIINVGYCSNYIMCDTSNSLYKNFDSNNKSGIIKIVYGRNSFLFVGDAEFDAEEILIEYYGKFLNSEVLKIGHHGSKSSTSNSFLEIVDPEIGIISAGIMNRFNHPSDIVLDKLKSKNINIFRTDMEGAIILASNGNTINKINWQD